MKTIQQRVLILAAITAATGVLCGALGAHALEQSAIQAQFLNAWKTGVLYHLIHALGLALVALAAPYCQANWWKRTVAFQITGIALFSGSLYAMALLDVAGLHASLLGPLTPVGGIALVLSWIFFALALRPAKG